MFWIFAVTAIASKSPGGAEGKQSSSTAATGDDPSCAPHPATMGGRTLSSAPPIEGSQLPVVLLPVWRPLSEPGAADTGAWNL